MMDSCDCYTFLNGVPGCYLAKIMLPGIKENKSTPLVMSISIKPEVHIPGGFCLASLSMP
jgi:hypothetical protein